jgi:hypothetical protein
MWVSCDGEDAALEGQGDLDQVSFSSGAMYVSLNHGLDSVWRGLAA